MINQKGGLNQEVLRQFSLAKMNQTPGNQGSYALQVIILDQLRSMWLDPGIQLAQFRPLSFNLRILIYFFTFSGYESIDQSYNDRKCQNFSASAYSEVKYLNTIKSFKISFFELYLMCSEKKPNEIFKLHLKS